MGYTLKTTGLASKLAWCVAVDTDGAVREFVNVAVSSQMALDPAVLIGTASWKGASRKYFQTLANGEYGFKGLLFGASKPSISFPASTGGALFMACAGATLGTGQRSIVGISGNDSVLSRSPSTGRLRVNYAGGRESVSIPPSDGSTGFSCGLNHRYGVGWSIFYGLESGVLALDNSGADTGYGGGAPAILGIGGLSGYGSLSAKYCVVCAFTSELSLAEFQALHSDWVAALFETGDTVVPTLSGTISVGAVSSNSIQISWPAGADNLAVTGYDVSSNGGGTWVSVGNVLSYTFTGLSPATSFALRVRARDAAGNLSAALAATQSTAAAAATALTLSGPASGAVGAASSAFTVGANGVISGSHTVTPSDAGGGGSFSPGSVTLSAAAPSATFSYTPLSAGSKTIGATDAGGYTAPTPLSYLAVAPGATLSSSVLTNNTGLAAGRHLNAPFEAFVHHPVTGALVLKKSGLTSNAAGQVVFSDTALSAAMAYRVVWRRTDTGAEGLETLTAS